MERYELHLGSCLETLRTMPDNSVDSVVTDPPYGLSFMGKRWDYDVPSTEIWAECLRVLKPGGHLLAFAGTRTQHRMAVRIEDAGFEIRDMIAWVYGSGFPKSRNIAEQDMIGDEAAQWQGWGTALKPALEPITVARKPITGTVAANMLGYGTGAINIDACRVAASDAEALSKNWDRTTTTDIRGGSFIGGKAGGVDLSTQASALGRWPANLIHDGSDEVVALFPAQAGAAAPVRGTEASEASTGAVTGKRARVVGEFHGDSGSAARFFYCAKTSRKDRNDGLHCSEVPAVNVGATMRDCERAEWSSRNGNHHPTVKPTDLMAYLCRLVTQPGGVVLDPFMGSGSTGKAAIREGFRFIGIERDTDEHGNSLGYMAIARSRIEHEASKCVKKPANDNAEQIDLFAEGI